MLTVESWESRENCEKTMNNSYFHLPVITAYYRDDFFKKCNSRKGQFLKHDMALG